MFSYHDFTALEFVPQPYRPLALQIFRVVQGSGLVSELEITSAAYRWLRDRASLAPICQGLEAYFKSCGAGGEPGV